MAKLTTHILDLGRGGPAAGVRIRACAMRDGAWECLRDVRSNGDGRCDGPLLDGARFGVGRYRLEFHVGEYFRAADPAGAGPAFLDVVPVEFGVDDAAAHYHVPLLVTPWSYSTYRGS